MSDATTTTGLDLPDHAKPKHPGGRPPVWTPERIAEAQADLLLHIIDGGSLDDWCSRHSVGKRTVYGWVNSSPEFRNEYARAREMQGDTYADKVADVTALVMAGKLDPQAGRTAADNYKWLAGKRKPKVYGDRIDVNQTVSGNVQVGWVIDLTPAADGPPVLDGTAVRVLEGPGEQSDPLDVV